MLRTGVAFWLAAGWIGFIVVPWNAIGGSGRNRVKRATSAERDTPTAVASSATVHGCAGRLCSSARLLPTTGSRAAASHPVD